MIHTVRNRNDRCSLERIMGILFYLECPQSKSILGNIFHYANYGYSYDQYTNALKKQSITLPIIKVWTGR